MQITRASYLSSLSSEEVAMLMPGKNLSLESRLSKEWAEWLWEQMQRGEFALTAKPSGIPGEHSAAVVAVDQWGSVAAVVHSTNALWWGETGIFVDGVSIPDSAAHQLQAVARAGPGVRLPDPTNPLIILRDGKPVLGSASIGDIHRETMQRLVSVLDHGMDPKSALDAPTLLSPSGDLAQIVERVSQGDFDERLLDAVRVMGQPVQALQLPFEEQMLARGWWVGIVIDPEAGTLDGGGPQLFGGHVEGY